MKFELCELSSSTLGTFNPMKIKFRKFNNINKLVDNGTEILHALSCVLIFFINFSDISGVVLSLLSYYCLSILDVTIRLPSVLV